MSSSAQRTDSGTLPALSPDFGTPTELLPGFVHIPRVLTTSQQQYLVDTACTITDTPTEGSHRDHPQRQGGWWRLSRYPNAPRQLNDGNKARFWDDISLFPTESVGLCHAILELVAKHFPHHQNWTSFQPKVGCLNFYCPFAKMNWHVDDTNFAKVGA